MNRNQALSVIGWVLIAIACFQFGNALITSATGTTLVVLLSTGGRAVVAGVVLVVLGRPRR
jgi:hypothetical protein